ncbi:hypothetical protein GF312_13615 [Candidatus Poribacteria bacterium]|nr:hypothetical protein [Candidatus Poribacteria bacterium]
MQTVTDVLYEKEDNGGITLMILKQDNNLIRKAASGDIGARLQLVKDNLDLVVEIASIYADKTNRPFSHMVKNGAIAVIKAADCFCDSQEMDFDDYVKFEVSKAIERVV